MWVAEQVILQGIMKMKRCELFLIVPMHMVLTHWDMKSFVKLPLAGWTSLYFENRKINKRILPPYFCTYLHQGLRGTLHMVSEQKFKTLGPDGLIDMQVCCELGDLTM